MDSTVIQPAPGQAILSTEGHHGHGHGGHDRHPHDWDQTILREQAAGFREAASSRAEAVRDTKDARFEVSSVVNAAATASALASCKTDDAICGLGSQVAVSAKDTAVGFKDVQVQALQIESRALLEAAKNANALAVQADKNYYQLQLQAQTNAAAAALAAEKCCCELKMAITAEGVATRGLIEDNEKSRLQAQLSAQQAQLAAYYARNAAPVTPV